MTNKTIIKEGDVYSRLTLTGKEKPNNGLRYVEAICICGDIGYYILGNLRRGNTTSCGCAQKEIAKAVNTRHGHTSRYEAQHPLYRIYAGIKTRCYNPNEPCFRNYGARGIKMCDRWLNSFDDFLEDIGPRPSKIHTLDRFPDKNGDYEPNNVRWATPKMQGRNTNKNVMVTAFGETKCVTEWTEDQRCGMSVNGLWLRIKKGMNPEEAILKPSQSNKAA